MSDQRIEYGFPYKPPHSQKAHVKQALKEWYVEQMEQYPLILEKSPANATLDTNSDDKGCKFTFID